MCVCLYELVVYDVWSRDIHVLSAIRTHLFPLSIRPCVGIVRGLKNIYILYGIFTSVSVRTCLDVYVGYTWTLTCIRWSMNQIWKSDMESNDFKISALTKSLMSNLLFFLDVYIKLFYWSNTFYKIKPFRYLQVRYISQIWFKALNFYTIVDIFRCSLYSSSNVLPLRALFKTTRLTNNEFKLFFCLFRFWLCLLYKTFTREYAYTQFCKYILNYFSYCLNVYDKGDMQNKKVT